MLSFFRRIYHVIPPSAIRKEIYTVTGIATAIGIFAYNAHIERQEYILSLGHNILDKLNKSSFNSAEAPFSSQREFSSPPWFSKVLVSFNITPLFPQKERVSVAQQIEQQQMIICDADTRFTHPQLKEKLSKFTHKSVNIILSPTFPEEHAEAISAYLMVLLIIGIYREGLLTFLSDKDIKKLNNFQKEKMDIIEEVYSAVNSLPFGEKVSLMDEIFHPGNSMSSYELLAQKLGLKQTVNEKEGSTFYFLPTRG